MLTSFSRKNLTSPSSESLMPKDLSMPKSPFSTAINTERKCSTSVASQVWSITLFWNFISQNCLSFSLQTLKGPKRSLFLKLTERTTVFLFPWWQINLLFKESLKSVRGQTWRVQVQIVAKVVDRLRFWNEKSIRRYRWRIYVSRSSHIQNISLILATETDIVS